MWTRFMDMHSGGGQKEDFAYLYIEAPEEEAKVIFYNRYGHSPDRVSCTCCGDDYSISSEEDLGQLTAYDRNCAYRDGKYVEEPRTDYGRTNPLISLDEYKNEPGVKFVYKEDILPEERIGECPRQGYVWMD